MSTASQSYRWLPALAFLFCAGVTRAQAPSISTAWLQDTHSAGQPLVFSWNTPGTHTQSGTLAPGTYRLAMETNTSSCQYNLDTYAGGILDFDLGSSANVTSSNRSSAVQTPSRLLHDNSVQP